MQAAGIDQLLQRGLASSAFDARQQMRFKPERPEVRPWSKVKIREIGDCGLPCQRRLQVSAPRLASLFSVAASGAKLRRATNQS